MCYLRAGGRSAVLQSGDSAQPMPTSHAPMHPCLADSPTTLGSGLGCTEPHAASGLLLSPPIARNGRCFIITRRLSSGGAREAAMPCQCWLSRPPCRFSNPRATSGPFLGAARSSEVDERSCPAVCCLPTRSAGRCWCAQFTPAAIISGCLAASLRMRDLARCCTPRLVGGRMTLWISNP